MATVLIRNLDDALHARLKARAAAAGRSMEEEARLAAARRLDADRRPAADPGRALPAGCSAARRRRARRSRAQPGQRPPPDFSGPDAGDPTDRPVILLDTNVISELARPAPHQAVTAYARSPGAGDGFHRQRLRRRNPSPASPCMPAGRRRARSPWPCGRPCAACFGGRILPFDRAPRRALWRDRRPPPRGGRPAHRHVEDAMIAAAGRARLRRHRHPQHQAFCRMRRAADRSMADPLTVADGDPAGGARPRLACRRAGPTSLGHRPRLRPPGALARHPARLRQPSARLGGVVPGEGRGPCPGRPGAGRQPSRRARRPARLRRP